MLCPTEDDKTEPLLDIGRRKFTTGAAAAALAALNHSVLASLVGGQLFFHDRVLPIGLQLYSLGDTAHQDFDGALAQVAAIGYRTVEISDPFDRPASAVAGSIQRAGLRCPSMHTTRTETVDIVVPEAQALGCQYIIATLLKFPTEPPAVTHGRAMGEFLIRSSAAMTIDDWKRSAEDLNRLGALYRQHGLGFGYHNHNHEFVTPKSSRVSGFEILLRETDPALVVFQMDVGWVAAAGRDPIELLRAYSGRFKLMHVKDVGPNTKPNYTFQQQPEDVGDGILPWTKILPAAYEAGVRYFYVEREPPYAVSAIESARRSFEFLNRLRA